MLLIEVIGSCKISGITASSLALGPTASGGSQQWPASVAVTKQRQLGGDEHRPGGRPGSTGAYEGEPMGPSCVKTKQEHASRFGVAEMGRGEMTTMTPYEQRQLQAGSPDPESPIQSGSSDYSTKLVNRFVPGITNSKLWPRGQASNNCTIETKTDNKDKQCDDDSYGSKSEQTILLLINDNDDDDYGDGDGDNDDDDDDADDDSNSNNQYYYHNYNNDQHDDSKIDIHRKKLTTYLINSEANKNNKHEIHSNFLVNKISLNNLVNTNCKFQQQLHHRSRTRAIKMLNCQKERQKAHRIDKTIIRQSTGNKICCDDFLYNRKIKLSQPNSLPIKLVVLVQLLFIYIIFTSITRTTTILFQQASATSSYWPLVSRTRHQQALSGSDIQPQSSRHDYHRHLIGPLQQSAAAAAASAAAVAATASAALARRGQHQNLMIGQHYNNFSSIVPYSIVQDADYGSIQEDQSINEQLPSNDMSDTLSGIQQQQQQQQTLQQDDIRSDSSLNIITEPQAQTIHQAIHATQQRASDRALLPLDSNRLILPQMQQIKSRFNQGCVGGTKCQFFAFCWMSGGSLGASCGLLMTCCVTPSRQEIQPGFYGPVVNDPCK